MRILFVANPALSHVLPMVPLAWASRVAGHEVLVATGSFVGHIRSAGLPVIDVAPEFDSPKWDEQLTRVLPDVEEESAVHFHGLRLATMNDTLARGLTEIVEQWRPQLIVYSEYTIVGEIVAERNGVPAIRHDVEICGTSPLLEYVNHLLVTRFGHREVPRAVDPENCVTISPPSLVQDGRPAGFPMRYVPYNGGMVLPDWLRRPPTRPRVVVTEGTTDPGDKSGRLGRVLAAAPGVDADFVLAVDAGVAEAHAPLPGNVYAPGWVPLTDLLRGAAGLVHHGGAGTTLNAIHAGVPTLTVPDQIPRHVNSKAMAALGACVNISADQLDADALRRLVEDTSLVEGTGRLRAEMAAMPSPAQVVPLLEELVK